MSGFKAGRCSKTLWSSGRGLAAPVSTLIIFVSLTLTVSSLYYLATVRVGAHRGDLRFTAAEEKMLELGSSIDTVAWAPSSSVVVSFSNYEGTLRVEPLSRRLVLQVTVGASTHTLLNITTGRVVYEMPSRSSGCGTYLRGDVRAIVNRSTSIMSQVYLSVGDEREELIVGYRPLVSSSTGGLVGGRKVNKVRIYVITLNASDDLTLSGEFHVAVSCVNVSSSLHTYNASSISSITVSANLEGTQSSVLVPVESGPNGVQVRVEVVVCSIAVRGVGL
ncbi:hypothetical protein J7L60_01360 [Candidatus Bathyarchaeota archaeon]|nr:hypothetical protein [Candidatus Bathyarchaeota archaeon]